MAGNTTGPVHRGEEGFWMYGRFYKYLELLDDEERTMPFTVPDEDLAAHTIRCRCKPCRAPHVRPLKEERIHRMRSRIGPQLDR